MVATLPSAVEREVYGGRAAEAAHVSMQTLLSEVERIRKQRLRQAKRQQDKVDLAPMTRRQPRIRGAQYEDPRSAQAEEQLLALVIQEPGLLDEISLQPEEFSSPLLGKAFAAWRQCWTQGGSPGINTLGENFDAAEISHLSAVLSRWDQTVSSEALMDCVEVIRSRNRASRVQTAEDMLAYQKYIQGKKGLGG